MVTQDSNHGNHMQTVLLTWLVGVISVTRCYSKRSANLKLEDTWWRDQGDLMTSSGNYWIYRQQYINSVLYDISQCFKQHSTNTNQKVGKWEYPTTWAVSQSASDGLLSVTCQSRASQIIAVRLFYILTGLTMLWCCASSKCCRITAAACCWGIRVVQM